MGPFLARLRASRWGTRLGLVLPAFLLGVLRGVDLEPRRAGTGARTGGWRRRAVGLVVPIVALVVGGMAPPMGALGQPQLTWVHLNPAASPEVRYLATMADDPATGQLLLFGGLGTSGPLGLGDTWVWTGSIWSQLSPATNPPARFGATMADDPATGQLVLFGGENGPVLGDTWTLVQASHWHFYLPLVRHS